MSNKQEQVPGVKSFSCPGCGGSVFVRAYGQSLSAVCEYCGAILDPSDPNFKIIQEAEKKMKYTPVLPLGSRCSFEGREWEVIGFMVRGVQAWSYVWQEYLLFNPRYGYRFLVNATGHWSYVRTITGIPGYRRSTRIRWKDHEYKLYSKESSKVIFVLGEFFWQVRRGEKVGFADYISDSGGGLSFENDNNSLVWSEAEYIEAEEVTKAFGGKLVMPPREGVNPLQKNPYSDSLKFSWKLALVAMAILVFAQVAFIGMAPKKKVLSQDILIEGVETTAVFPSVEISGRKTNLQLMYNTSLNDSWMEINTTLVDQKSGDVYPASSVMEYYTGYDEGVFWSEGNNKKEIILNGIPPGVYDVNLDLSCGKPSEVLHVEMVRGVNFLSNLLFALGIIVLPLIAIYLMYRSFEVKKWADSDYNPYASEEDE